MPADNSWPAEPPIPMALTAYDGDPVVSTELDTRNSQAWLTPGLIVVSNSDGTAELKPAPPVLSTKAIDAWWKKLWGNAPRGVRSWPPQRQPWQLPE